MTKQVRHEKTKRGKGQCAWGGCQVDSGDAYHCGVHAEKRAQYMRGYRKARKEPRAAA